MIKANGILRSPPTKQTPAPLSYLSSPQQQFVGTSPGYGYAPVSQEFYSQQGAQQGVLTTLSDENMPGSAVIKRPKKNFQNHEDLSNYVSGFKQKYKTEICRNWEITGFCEFRDSVISY